MRNQRENVTKCRVATTNKIFFLWKLNFGYTYFLFAWCVTITSCPHLQQSHCAVKSQTLMVSHVKQNGPRHPPPTSKKINKKLLWSSTKIQTLTNPNVAIQREAGQQRTTVTGQATVKHPSLFSSTWLSCGGEFSWVQWGGGEWYSGSAHCGNCML